MGASAWDLNVRGFLLLSPAAQKETGSELAAFLSCVIMFYRQGGFNV